jgi:hypothetical protein
MIGGYRICIVALAHKGGGDAPGQPEGNLNDSDFKVTILDARNLGIPRTA